MEKIMAETIEDTLKDRVEQLVDYIMKWCLWQFHSRAWDREKQNEGNPCIVAGRCRRLQFIKFTGCSPS